MISFICETASFFPLAWSTALTAVISHKIEDTIIIIPVNLQQIQESRNVHASRILEPTGEEGGPIDFRAAVKSIRYLNTFPKFDVVTR